MALFEIKNLSFSYPNSSKIIDDINFEIEEGDFTVLCGPTGSGKTTLLRLLKPELSPIGNTEGEIYFNGELVSNLSLEKSAKIGFVQQSVEQQIVTDKVWHEIAFGMENLNFSQSLMRRRVAEIMSYFGIDNLFDCNTSELSGGQKQIISLASVIAMNPKAIIFDEPTSQLDPVSASEFLTTIKKLNDELGITVIITEHRLENVIPLCNKIIFLDSGKITSQGKTKETIEKIIDNDTFLNYMPGSVKIYSLLKKEGECPLNVTEGKSYLKNHPLPDNGEYIPTYEEISKEPVVKLKDVCFRYDKNSNDVLKDTCLTAYKNEILCVLGANGSGKTTMLYSIAGLINPYAGKIEILGKNIKKYKNNELYDNCIAMLPQNVETVFLHNTLKEELDEVNTDFSIIPYDLSYAADRHPYDLSGGEQQLAALGKILASKPQILLLDEPTKGLDSNAKFLIADVLKKLKYKGITVIVVTHDVEFSAMCADRVAMFFRGKVTCIDTPHKFFSENLFYTTSINRITKDFCKNLVTFEDLKKYIGGTV